MNRDEPSQDAFVLSLALLSLALLSVSKGRRACPVLSTVEGPSSPVVGTKMEPHTPTPSFPRPGGSPSPGRWHGLCCNREPGAHLHPLGVPVATGMGGSRAEPAPYPIRGGNPSPGPRRRTPGRQSKTAPKTTHPNTTAPRRKRQGSHSQEGPGVRAHGGGKGRKTRTREAHHRRA